MDLAFLPAHELLRQIREREITSSELLQHLARRIEELNPTINGIVTLDLERASDEARAADEAIASGSQIGPLHGLPITVKDSLETKGMRTTSGAPWLADHIPTRDAVAVERVRRAGAIVMGKTNLPTMADDYETFNPLFGTTNNPWNTKMTAGGSSGGAAASVAAGLTTMEIGSDLGGSIRIPSAFCGVYGLKPSFGIIPKRGHIPGPPGTLFDPDIGCLGPIARSPEDIRMMLGVLAGPSDADAVGWTISLPKASGRPLESYRVAAWIDDPSCPVDSSVTAVVSHAIEEMRTAGVTVVDARPDVSLRESAFLREQLTVPLGALGLSDEAFDELADEMRTVSLTQDDPSEKRSKKWQVQSHRDWLVAAERRAHLREDWAKFFETVDLLITPATSTAAFPHDQSDFHSRTISINGSLRNCWEAVGWWSTFVGVAYLPAMACPVGLNQDGLPVGVQIVGPYLRDEMVIEFATHLANVMDGFRPPTLEVR